MQQNEQNEQNKPNKPKKRLIVCCDGTWQKPSSKYPTNVVKIAQAIKPFSDDGTAQIVFYDEGVGSGNLEWLEEAYQIVGGAFGVGLYQNIQDAYLFLSLNYEPGDEIYLFGFSRGAYTVRSLAGLIYSSGGLLSRANIREAPFVYDLYQNKKLTVDDKIIFRQLPIPYEDSPHVKRIQDCRTEAEYILCYESCDQKKQKVSKLITKYGFKEREDKKIRQEAQITVLGCWDTVGSLGIPTSIPFLSDWVNKKYGFHDHKLNENILHAFHAIAIDEHREVFNVTHMTNSKNRRKKGSERTLSEVWFPGGHSSVGGGNSEEKGLSNAALLWMIKQIENKHKEHKEQKEQGGNELGLEFDLSRIEGGINTDHTRKFDTCDGITNFFFHLLGFKDREIPKCPQQFTTCPQQLDILHESTKKRWRDDPSYRPRLLKAAYEKELNEWAQNNPTSV